MHLLEAPWPRKTRELMNHHMDSTVWNGFAFRDGDIIVASYAKSGTTWVQQIAAQLVFGGDPEVSVAELSPWVELRLPPKEARLRALEAQTHRRILKTHLPVDALVFSPEARYLYIGRDGRDILCSWHHHHSHMNRLFYMGLNDSPGRVGPPLEAPDPDFRRYFRTWLEQDGHPIWSLWESARSWWEIRHLPNVLLLHFNRLKADLPGELDRIAAFLGIEPSPELRPRLLEHCSFAFMKAHAPRVAPLGGAVFNGGASRFINQGTNGRWRKLLSAEESEAYERVALERLGEDCARWLATGEGA